MSGNRKRRKSLSSNTSHGRSSEANDSTSLLNASALGNTEKVKLLLAKDVDVNTTRNDGATPLALAVQGGHTETVDKLLQHPNIKMKKTLEGHTVALALAVQNGNNEIVELLLQRLVDDKEVPDPTGILRTFAQQKGHGDIASKIKVYDFFLKEAEREVKKRENEEAMAERAVEIWARKQHAEETDGGMGATG